MWRFCLNWVESLSLDRPDFVIVVHSCAFKRYTGLTSTDANFSGIRFIYLGLLRKRPLVTSPGSLGLRQTHPAQQIGVAGVGAHPVPEPVYP